MGPEGGANPLGFDEILETHGNPVQWTQGFAIHDRLFGPPGIDARLVVGDGDEGVQLRLQGVQAVKHDVRQLDRRQLARPDQGGQLRGRSEAEVFIRHEILAEVERNRNR